MLKKWTKQEEQILRKLRAEGRSVREISDLMGRDANSVDHKIYALKIPVLSAAQNEIKINKQSERMAFIKEMGQQLVSSFNVNSIKLPQIISKIKYAADKKEEWSILDISDVHLGVVNKVFDTTQGKQVVTYDFNIFQQELERLRQSVIEIHNLLSNAYNLKHLYINILGDILTNDRIFTGQIFQIDRCVGQQLWDSVAHLVNFINSMKVIYEKITVTCVIGNHGRSTAEYSEEPVENSFEYHLYRIIQQTFEKDQKIEVIVPNTQNTIVEIAGHKHLLMHGDQFRGSGGNMSPKIEKLYVNVGGFSVVDMGHFHNCKEDNISDKILVKQNGAWIEKEDYAYKRFRTYSIPKQHFYGCNKRRACTWSYTLDLRKN